MARRSCRRRDFWRLLQELRTDVAEEIDVQRVGQPQSGCPFSDDAVAEGRVEPIVQPIAQDLGPKRKRGILIDYLARFAEPDDIGHILGSRTTTGFMPGPVNERFQLAPFADIRAPTPFGA